MKPKQLLDGEKPFQVVNRDKAMQLVDRGNPRQLVNRKKDQEQEEHFKQDQHHQPGLEQMEEQHRLDEQVEEFPYRCRPCHLWLTSLLMEIKDKRPGVCTRICEPRLIYLVVLVNTLYIYIYHLVKGFILL